MSTLTLNINNFSISHLENQTQKKLFLKSINNNCLSCNENGVFKINNTFTKIKRKINK